MSALDHLTSAGSFLYSTGETDRAAETYRRAAAVAAAGGDLSGEIDARFWEGCSLHGSGRLREALVAMAPMLAARGAALDQPEYYRLVTRYLRAMVELPAERASVEAALDEAERELAARGMRSWRSRGLLTRARLALSTGEWTRGLTLITEARAARSEDPWGCTWTSHFWVTALLAIWTGDLARADKLFREWRDIEVGSTGQRAFLPLLRATRLRREGRAAEALGLAREAYANASGVREYAGQICGAVELARVLLALGEPENAAPYVRDALRFRRSEVGEHGFAVRTLLADLWLARARALAGLPGWDLEFHHAYERKALTRVVRRVRSASRHGRGDAQAALRRAERAYAAVRPLAARLDALYATELRVWQLADRAESVRRTREEIA